MNAISICNTSIRQFNSLYSLNDLHQASGGQDKHSPRRWLQNQQTIDLANECEKDGKPSILKKQGFGTFVCKELVIHYAMWISPSFSLQVIRCFLDTVSGSLQPKLAQTTVADRTPLRQAVSALVGKCNIDYSSAYNMVHQRFGVDSIEEIAADKLPDAIAYIHALTLHSGLVGEVLDRQPEKTEITFSQSELRELATVTYYCAWSNNILRELAEPLTALGYERASTVRTLPMESRGFIRRIHRALTREMPKMASAFERDCMQNSLARCEMLM